MLDLPEQKISSPPMPNGTPSLLQWLYQAIDVPKIRLQVRSRGNNLYVLCEGNLCPDQLLVLKNLVKALVNTNLQRMMPAGESQIYQVVLYGREKGQARPTWVEVLHLDQIHQHYEELIGAQQTTRDPIAPSSSLILSNYSLAKQGRPDAIARYLSEELSALGVGVRADARSAKLSSEATVPQTANLASVFSTQSITPQSLLSRLWILCESAYSPDASLVAEPLAKKLRGLELSGFRDAIVFCQVQGESKPDWALRVDLTPPNEMLKEWSRWGDVDALNRLLNRVLEEQSIEVMAELLDITLHVTCQGKTVPDKKRLLSKIAPLLETIAPQGVHATAFYGVERQKHTSSIPDSPVWVEWLNLPAAEHPALADTTKMLAENGDLSAIAFLLTRQLNPDLDQHLTTGGIRIQIRQKDDLMHVMTDAPICPPQSRVSSTVSKYIKALKLPGVKGVRVYGRRAGQSRVLWTHVDDFEARNRLVPAAIPEFAASDAYVGDLLSRESGEIDLYQERPPIASRVVEGIQWMLVRSQLFTMENPASLSTTDRAKSATKLERSLTVVWGVLGVLLTVQADWMLGQLLKAPTPPVATAAAPITPTEQMQLPTLSLQKTTGFGEFKAIAGSSFTQAGQTVMSAPSQQPAEDTTPKALLASPLRPKAAVDSAKSPYPSFNATQLGEKLVLYRQYVAQHGAPDVLIVGSSRAMRGIDPVALQQTLASQGYPDLKIFNFGVNGATVQVVDLIVRRMLPAEKMPRMILFADGARAFNSGRVDVTYNAIAVSPGFKKLPDSGAAPSATEAFTKPLETISQTNSIVADSYQNFNTQLNQAVGNLSTVYGQREKMISLLRSQLAGHFGGSIDAESLISQDGQGLIDINGFLPIPNRFNPVTYYQKYSRVPGNVDGDYANFSLEGRQDEALKTMMQFTQSQKIPVVIVNLPLTEQYLDSDRRAREQEFQQYLIRTSTELGFTYRDLLETWKTQNDYFSDPSHINRYGAYAVSQHLARDPMIPWVKR
jgi:hypothetical protein